MAIIDDKSDQKIVTELGMLDSILVAIRLIACIGAGAAIVVGVVMAIQLFSLFQEVIRAPEPILQGWQQALAHGPEKERGDVGQDATPEGEAVVAEDSDDAMESPSESNSLATIDTSNEMERTEDKKTDPPNQDGERERRRKRTDTIVEELPAYIGIADRIIDQFENGEFGWLAGIGMLGLFCWLLVKIPIMLITLGSRLLLGLVNVSSEG